ncbi:hypothetical protein D3C75_1178310 [compost metagenome]
MSTGNPPVYGGMLPSALPAFSAPNSVKVVPSCAASCSDTAAITLKAMLGIRSPVITNLKVFMRVISSDQNEVEKVRESQSLSLYIQAPLPPA